MTTLSKAFFGGRIFVILPLNQLSSILYVIYCCLAIVALQSKSPAMCKVPLPLAAAALSDIRHLIGLGVFAHDFVHNFAIFRRV